MPLALFAPCDLVGLEPDDVRLLLASGAPCVGEGARGMEPLLSTRVSPGLSSVSAVSQDQGSTRPITIAVGTRRSTSLPPSRSSIGGLCPQFA